MAPWNGPRHWSWASNANIGLASCAVVFITYIIWSILDPNHVPSGLVTLLGLAGGAWFGAITDDKRRRDRDVENTANRAEAKVDRLTDVAEAEHPGSTAGVAEGNVKPPGGGK